MVVTLILICLGLYGVASAVQALRVGEVPWVWSMLGGWGKFRARFSRDDEPLFFWAATTLYGAGGVALVGLAIVRWVAR
jgi:hypothetical protein